MVVDISELDAEGNIAITEVAGRLTAALRRRASHQALLQGIPASSTSTS